MSDKIKFVIIKENGNIVTIFASINSFDENIVEINSNDDINSIINYYEDNKDKIYKSRGNSDNHIFYLQDYLKTHFNKEFKEMKIDPFNIHDDLFLYYLVSLLNNIVIVNSESHTDIAIIPSDGISEVQVNSLNKAINLFDDSINWCVSDNMFLETINEDSKKYKILNYGKTKNGKIKDIIKEYMNNDRFIKR